MITEIGLGLIRNVLLSAGAGLVTNGYVTHDQLGLIVGALITIGSVIASIVSNRAKAKAVAVQKAVEAHPGLMVTSTNHKPTIVVNAAYPNGLA